MPEDVPRLAELLGEAFVDDAMLTSTLPSEGVAERIRHVFEVLDRAAVDLGWMWTTMDVSGAAMWVPPKSQGAYEGFLERTADALTHVIEDQGSRYDSFWSWIEEHRPSEPHWYLDHLAVASARRGAGVGSALLEHGLDFARADGTFAFLITSKVGNVPYYEHRGFVIAEEAQAPQGGPHLWFMRCDVGDTGPS